MAARGRITDTLAAPDTPGGRSPDTQGLTFIRRSSGLVPINLRELWEYRELLYFLAWRDVKVRYKQTALGVAWAILQPFFAMVIFSIFFGELAGLPSDNVPYPVFVYSGLLPWTYFANALTHMSNSLVGQEALITKVYFPRLLIPLASVLSGLIDFVIAFSILIGMMLYYGLAPTSAILALPLFTLLGSLAALGAGLWLSALNVQYRDVQYILPFIVQFWLFATPIVYPSSLVPAQWRAFYGLNPMASVVEGFRWALLDRAHPDIASLAVSVLTVGVVLMSGLYYFRRMEKTFADVI